jgi:hypothetical protein
MGQPAAHDHKQTLIAGRAVAACSVLTIPWRRGTITTRGECARLR